LLLLNSKLSESHIVSIERFVYYYYTTIVDHQFKTFQPTLLGGEQHRVEIHSLDVLVEVLARVQARLTVIDDAFEAHKDLSPREQFLFTEVLCIETDVVLLSLLLKTIDPNIRTDQIVGY
jgi:hypothetical protein